MSKYLGVLKGRSVAIIREAKAQFKNPVVLWSTGKESTTTPMALQKAFPGKIPFRGDPHRQRAPS